MVLWETADATALVTQVTTAISDNIAPVLVVLGAVVGMRFAARLLNGSTKGKVRI